MEKRKHAVKVVKVIGEKRYCLVLWWQRTEDGALEEVTKDFGFPICPFMVVDGDLRNHILERIITGSRIHPLNAFGREDGKS